MAPKIRPIAICIFYHNGKILATEGYDEITKEKFFRPIGGGIEFGETGKEALIREIKEELDTEVKAIKEIGLFENIFTYQGQPGHEIIFVYDGEFIDQNLYTQEKIVVTEGETKTQAVWLKIEELIKDEILLYPVGLKELVYKRV
ncbi:MAG: NUDIX hydrolase [Candidatus Buchananbacteria bacterium]